MMETLKLIYVCYMNMEGYEELAKEVLERGFDCERGKITGSDAPASFDEFTEQVNTEFKALLPDLEEEPNEQKPLKNKSLSERKVEAAMVKEILENSPVLPQGAGEVYHIVSMNWF